LHSGDAESTDSAYAMLDHFQKKQEELQQLLGQLRLLKQVALYGHLLLALVVGLACLLTRLAAAR
jgi:hypothetical protein